MAPRLRGPSATYHTNKHLQHGVLRCCTALLAPHAQRLYKVALHSNSRDSTAQCCVQRSTTFTELPSIIYINNIMHHVTVLQNRTQPPPLLSARPVPSLVRFAAHTLYCLCAVVLVLPVLPKPCKCVLSAVVSLLRVNCVVLSASWVATPIYGSSGIDSVFT